MEVFVGTFVHATEENPMAILTDSVMVIKGSTIVCLDKATELDKLQEQYGFSDSSIYRMTKNQFLIPGFIDTHIHAAQYPNNGVSDGLTLLEWLQIVTFPTEASFKDTFFAKNVYSKVVDRLLRNGTTTASYYATIHLEGTKILADVVSDRGQRALIGKVNMVRNCPDYYKENNFFDSINETEQLIKYVKNLENDLVLPIITPRFAPTCTEEQMKALGQLAQKYECHIQSHLCECQSEIKWIKELFPNSKSYSHVYDDMNLLTDKTIMAHCVWISDEELSLLRERGTSISHCPNSNISLKSGICDSKRLLSQGMKLGLGTDCSGGYSPSLLDAIRMAVQSSRILAVDGGPDFKTLTIEEAFSLATLGGAKVLNMDKKIGNFEVCKMFDASLIDLDALGSPIDIFEKDSLHNKISKFLFCGDDRNIIRIYVNGNKVVDKNDDITHKYSNLAN